MATLNDIQTALLTVDPVVCYGMVDAEKVKSRWDYTVFGRRVRRLTGNKTGYADVYTVVIVREDYIPENLPDQIINAMFNICGMRLSDNDMQYNYTQKPNTNTVVEMLELEFTKPIKRVI